MPVNKPRTFEKRRGTTDIGKDFENVVVASLILDFLRNKNIVDFVISSNDEAFGPFDDVVVEVKIKNQDSLKFALQLKHSHHKRTLDLNSFSRKNFDVIRYFNSFLKYKNTLFEHKLILTTTFKFDLTDGSKIRLTDKNEFFEVEIFKCDESTALLNTLLKSDHCYKFRIDKDTATNLSTEKLKEYELFFENFYLYTDQKNLDQTKTDVLRKLQEEFSCDKSIFLQYIEYINQWGMREGNKEKLHKRMMAKFLTLSLLSPSIHPYTINNSVSENAEILQRAVAKFTVTVFDDMLLEEVQRVWGDAKEKLNMDIKEMNRIRRLYDPNCHYVEDLNILSDEDCSKFMWYVSEEYPLIVEETPLTCNAISLCREKKYVIIKRETSSIASDEFTIWEKLSQLRAHADVYKELTAKCVCRLPGWETSLADLIAENEKFLEIITTNELIKMIENPNVIKEKGKEELPEPYIDRFLSGNFFDFKYLDAVKEHTFIVLSNAQEEHITKYSNRENIFVTKERCGAEQFEKLCQERKEMKRFYHFVTTDRCLQLIRSKGDISDLEPFCIESIEEAAFYNPYYQNNINIITCEPGMAKSVFLKSLRNHFSSYIWNIILSPIDAFAICNRFRELGQYQIEEFILEMNYPLYNEFQKMVITLLMVKGKICYLWDALDELPNEKLVFITDVIFHFSRTDCIQWITSRSHLKGRLEEKFNLLSTSITPFDDQQQTRYIQTGLKSLNIGDNITEVIKRTIALAANTNILGIPLQIFMLTQLFLQDKEKAARLMTEQLLSPVDLYRYFIEGKFNVFYNKAGVDISENNSFHRRFLESNKRRQIQNYERVALNILFDDDFLAHLNVEHCNNSEIQQGDGIGLTTANDQEIQFVHVSYAEFFAASYLANHYKENLGLEGVISDKKYKNVRFFFDCLLAKDSLPHIAVLCKNLELLKQYENDLGDYKDVAGRNLLQLAASWGERYELFWVETASDATIIYANERVTEGTSNGEMLEYLLERCDVNEVDDLFKLDCLGYAEKFECLFNVVIIENRAKTGYLNSKNDTFICNILFYATYFGYDGIIDTYKNHAVNLKIRTHYSKKTLLHLAAINGQFQVAQLLINSGAEIEPISKEGYTPLQYALQHERFEVAQLLINSGANIEAVDRNHFTPLHHASVNGQFQVAQLLINSGAYIEAVSSYNRTPLHRAAVKGQLKIVQLLINFGANIEAVDCNNYTPLHYVSENGHLEVTRLLINSGANIEAINKYNRTPLHGASVNGPLEVAALLINCGANIEALDYDRYTPLHHASRKGQLEIAQLLINSRANIEAVNEYGYTSLHYASENGHFEVAQLLIKFGAKVEKYNRTPLHAASVNGHFEIAHLLISSGANIEAIDHHSCTPLHHASVNGSFEIVELLINDAANIEAVDKNGQTPLFYASENGRFDVAQLLINSGANIGAVNRHGFTPLHAASDNGHFEIGQLLITSGANIDAVAKEGGTPLHYASRKGQLEIAQLLIDFGANVQAVDCTCFTPLHHASANGSFEIVELLIHSGANVEAVDENGHTPLLYASENGRFEVAQFLISSGANIEAVNKYSLSSLHIASWQGQFEVVQLLISSGANIEAVANEGGTPLHYASKKGQLELVHLLLHIGADIEALTTIILHHYVTLWRMDNMKLHNC